MEFKIINFNIIGENKSGRKDLTKKSADINVYVINVSTNMVSTEVIHEIYSLLWQIEIFFYMEINF